MVTEETEYDRAAQTLAEHEARIEDAVGHAFVVVGTELGRGAAWPERRRRARLRAARTCLRGRREAGREGQAWSGDSSIRVTRAGYRG
jgi:hypothetical protein